MNSILQDMREIVYAAAPDLQKYGQQGPPEPTKLSKLFGSRAAHDYFLWRELWAAIKPVKFGNNITWSDASDGTLARYQVPRDFFNIVLRVRTYTVNYTSGALDLSLPGPPPSGSAWWEYQILGTGVAQVITDPDMPVQVMAEAEEFLIFRGGFYIVLRINFASAPPDDEARQVRTTVYSYNCGAAIIDRIGGNQAIAEIT
jgi:hypothetical protein